MRTDMAKLIVAFRIFANAPKEEKLLCHPHCQSVSGSETAQLYTRQRSIHHRCRAVSSVRYIPIFRRNILLLSSEQIHLASPLTATFYYNVKP
jgi:hypothetical protein